MKSSFVVIALLLCAGMAVAQSAGVQKENSRGTPATAPPAVEPPAAHPTATDSPPAIVFAPAAQGYRVVTRSDLSTRVDGRYIGHLYSETRAVLRSSASSASDFIYDGEVYRFEETLRDLIDAARKIDVSNTTTISLAPGPILQPDKSRKAGAADPGATAKDAADRAASDNGAGAEGAAGPGAPYPLLSPFPALPDAMPGLGDTWKGASIIYVDPLHTGVVSAVPVVCTYRFDGPASYQGTPALVLSGSYTLDYRRPVPTDADSAKGNDAATTAPPNIGDPGLATLDGSHRFSLAIAADGSGPLFLRDSIDETYGFTASDEVAKHFTSLVPTVAIPGVTVNRASAGTLTKVTYQGFALTWYTAIKPLPADSLVAQIRRSLPASTIPDVKVDARPDGVRITIEDVHFLPDRADVVPQDVPRLTGIAAILKSIPERTFRVVGHTADVGSTESQHQLSVARAKAIVDYLVAAGIPASRFIYEGKGGAEPVADNSTEAGRKQNRRVEITILQD